MIHDPTKTFIPLRHPQGATPHASARSSRQRAQRTRFALLAALVLTGITLTPSMSAATPTCYGLEPTYGCKVNGTVGLCLGTNGRDRIRGTDDDDVIIGLGGRDMIRGRGGNDTICGGAGPDRIRGGKGNDLISGDGQIAEAIVLAVPPSFAAEGLPFPRSALRGVVPTECLPTENPGTDPGDDRCIGQKGNDKCEAGPGDDKCSGGRDDDECHMEEGNDRCAGGPGNDLCDSGPGLDKNNLGSGEDLCTAKQPEDARPKGCEDDSYESCIDGVQNQDEWGVDCGGSCDKACGEGGLCSSYADCVGGACDFGIVCSPIGLCGFGTGSGGDSHTDCYTKPDPDAYCMEQVCGHYDYCAPPFEDFLEPDCRTLVVCSASCTGPPPNDFGCANTRATAQYAGTGLCLAPPDGRGRALPCDPACAVDQHGLKMSDVLNEHNAVRAKVAVAPLCWSNTLAARAQAWADECNEIGKGPRGGHSSGRVCKDPAEELPSLVECTTSAECPAGHDCVQSGIGENIAGFITGGGMPSPVDMWNFEECCYTAEQTVDDSGNETFCSTPQDSGPSKGPVGTATTPCSGGGPACPSGETCTQQCPSNCWVGSPPETTPWYRTNTSGHYTQLVWADTTHVGCGISECSGKAGFDNFSNVVCQYAPAGNLGSAKPF